MTEVLVRQLREKLAQELRRREIEFVSFWLEELQKLEGKRHRDLASLQNDLKNLITRMQNRLRTLKTSKPEL